MNIIKRLAERIANEGFINTIKYIAFVGWDSLRSFFLETVLDLKYSRRLLYGNKKTYYKHLGANDVYHTDYLAMPLIFGHADISPDDVLVDVGCGKGRVINYWLSQGYRNKIYGIELDHYLAHKTAKQLSKWDNVKIISGDAIQNLPNEGTIFYFYNPFESKKVNQFAQRLEELATDRQIMVLYYNPKSIQAFQNENWKIDEINFERDLGIKRWGRINKYHDLAIIKPNLQNHLSTALPRNSVND